MLRRISQMISRLLSNRLVGKMAAEPILIMAVTILGLVILGWVMLLSGCQTAMELRQIATNVRDASDNIREASGNVKEVTAIVARTVEQLDTDGSGSLDLGDAGRLLLGYLGLRGAEEGGKYAYGRVRRRSPTRECSDRSASSD